MFLKTQNKRTAAKKLQIPFAGTKTIGNCLPFIPDTIKDRRLYPRNGSDSTISGLSPKAVVR